MKMIQGDKKRFFPESYAFLGEMSVSDYSKKRCIIQGYAADRQRWIVKLFDPQFAGKCILVKEDKVTFDCYGAPDKSLPSLPSHLGVTSMGSCGNSLFTKVPWGAGSTVLVESPMMIVANSTEDHAFECRWNLYYALENERGPRSPLIVAFKEMSDGGPGVMNSYRQDALIMFEKILETSKKTIEDVRSAIGDSFIDEEVDRISGVLSRWQTNSHEYKVEEQNLSALYRYTAKMLHSCAPNCRLQQDPETGTASIITLRAVEAGEHLTNDYMGGETTGFQLLGVEERRERLKVRGFKCICKRCLIESGESEQAELDEAELEQASVKTDIKELQARLLANQKACLKQPERISSLPVPSAKVKEVPTAPPRGNREIVLDVPFTEDWEDKLEEQIAVICAKKGCEQEDLNADFRDRHGVKLENPEELDDLKEESFPLTLTIRLKEDVL